MHFDSRSFGVPVRALSSAEEGGESQVAARRARLGLGLGAVARRADRVFFAARGLASKSVYNYKFVLPIRTPNKDTERESTLLHPPTMQAGIRPSMCETARL